ncbi:MAG: hypothetical protein AMJ91_00700 [candidate division Zixibacteria bacterium SM23_73_3]|nr:MAG: hypothetical protein AMJ91_00700 [candidate division Zixibacteria bacterium SM23_73_3]
MTRDKIISKLVTKGSFNSDEVLIDPSNSGLPIEKERTSRKNSDLPASDVTSWSGDLSFEALRKINHLGW